MCFIQTLDYSKQKTTALRSQVNSQQNHISLLPSTYHISPYHLSASMSEIGQTLCKNGWDWSNFLWAWVGLTQLSARMDGIDQTFCRNKLVKSSVGMGGIGQTFCGNRRDWPNFLQEWVGLVKLWARMGGIGKPFCKSGWDWSNSLQE